MRDQITLRLSREEVATLDAAARRLRLDRASLIRAAALGVADLVLDSVAPLVLAVEPGALLRRMAERMDAPQTDVPASRPRAPRRPR
jgi:uncharacterized protein (DUF1778 family)